MDDDDLDWQVDGSWAGEGTSHSETHAPARGRTRVRSRVPLCTESGTGLPGSPGPTGVNDYADPQYRLNHYEREYQDQLLQSYRRVGISRRVEILHGGLLASAQQRARNISYQRWLEIRDDPDLARDLIAIPFQEVLNQIRDAGIQRILGEPLVRLLGAPMTYASGIQMLFEESSWESRSESTRMAYRTRQIYAFMLGVLAHNLAGGNIRRESEINQRLVGEGLRYLRWLDEERPRLRAWVRQHIPETERQMEWRAR